MGPCSTRRTGASSQSPQKPCPLAIRITTRLQRECQNVARFQWVDQGVAVAAAGGVPGIQPAFVIGAGPFHGLAQFFGQGTFFQFPEFPRVTSHHHANSIHTLPSSPCPPSCTLE